MSKQAFNKLLDAMRALCNEVNDQEICRRLETLMNTSKDDLSVHSVNELLDDPFSFDPREIQEPFTMYVKHFIYMVKRNEKLGIPSKYSQATAKTKKK
jgi:hypothetical protein